MSEEKKQDELKENTLSLAKNNTETLTLDTSKITVPKSLSASKRVRGKFVEVEVKGRGRRKKASTDAILEEPTKIPNEVLKNDSHSEKPEVERSMPNNVLTEEEKQRRNTILQNINSSNSSTEKIVLASTMKVVSTEKSDNIVEYKAEKKQQIEQKNSLVNDLQEIQASDNTTKASDVDTSTKNSSNKTIKQEEKKTEHVTRVVSFTPVFSSKTNEIIEPNANKEHNSPKENPSFYEEKEISKPKKKGAGAVDNKRQAKSNWKSVYVEEVAEEEDFEEGILLEEDVEVEQEEKPAVPYYKAPKRKSKYKNKSSKTKLVKTVKISDPLSVSDLALQVAEKSKVLINSLRSLGVSATDKTILDIETIELLLGELGHNFIKVDKKYLEDEYININEDDFTSVTRPPVVTIMGHVDHGKTTLLDTIRKSAIVDKESGGITQHIGAYQVKLPNEKVITFLDTPGHEAFTEIRSRGSSVTDIVILVVASDDSVKPQTIEAIQHATQANVPIIVAINKMDKPEANPMKVKTELLQHNVIVEEMGGEVLCVEISAKNNEGIDTLLENILLQAELMDLKSPLDAPAMASIVEVKQEKGLGFLATVLVQRGTLKIGDIFVCNTQIGRIKAMIDDNRNRVNEASISVPVEISGFTGVIEAGFNLIIVPSEKIANEIVSQRLLKQREEEKEKKFDLSALLAKSSGDVKTLSVVVKADTQGILEAIVSSLGKIKHPEIQLKIILKGVGEITETDISLSKTSGAIIVGFNVRANTKALDIAKKSGIEVRYHSIIYNLIDDVKLILSGMLNPDIVENIIGYAEVRQVFNITKFGNVAGCYVTEGYLKRNSYVRLLRNNVVIHEGVLSTLKREKDDAKEVKSNMECGASFENYNDIEIGDRIECYEKVEIRNSIK